MTAIAEAPTQTYTVQEAALLTGLSEHTLRYYERVHLIPDVRRDSSSRHRRYTQEDLRGIEFLKRMRATGMPIADMQRFVRLRMQGEDTTAERIAMLEAHRQRVQVQIAELQSHLAAIDYKIENYQQLELGRLEAVADCLEIYQEHKEGAGATDRRPNKRGKHK